MGVSSSLDLGLASGLQLRHAKCFRCISYDDGGFGFEKAFLDFGNFKIVFEVNDDTDEIVLRNSAEYNFDEWSNIVALQRYIDHEMSWSWRATNSQGYHDAILISFDIPIPQFMFISAASMISLYSISPT